MKLNSIRLEDNPRYQAAQRTCERSGDAFKVNAPHGDGWTWIVIALALVVGLAVVGLA